ncbi:hypothetical protein COCNU_06G002760 [Cocos nucifera]|uniref:NECAP PHear domain-containing protein n=1 Tax=Cocos nucifera TaxID=13894 RepID=A0A8K0N2U9_COCNU|nr:hypothetical protein COCNU_06G002760 [Cocos nucifera]
MEEQHQAAAGEGTEQAEAVELVLFHVNECYVYLVEIMYHKGLLSEYELMLFFRADEWNVNKWNWEGALKVISKGEECIVRLEDKTTGELYARAFLREGEPHPVEPVIDSSRYLNKKKTAEEMEQHYQTSSSVDYSLKEGETLVLQIKNVSLLCLSCSDILLSVENKPMAGDLTDIKMIQQLVQSAEFLLT